MKTAIISGEDEHIDGLVEMLTEQAAHTGDHLYKIKVETKTKLTLGSLNKMIKDKEKTEITRHKGEFWILHICKNNVPVPLFHSKDIQEVALEIENGRY